MADRRPPEAAITLEVLPVRDGDCLLVSCPIADGTWRLLVDTGRKETWPVLRDRLSDIPLDQHGWRHIDLVIVSHIDNDHIGATQSLFADQGLALMFGDVWFNARKHLARGVAAGEKLSKLLAGLDRQLPWNTAFSGEAVVIPIGRKFFEVPSLPGFPQITLLSPTTERLANLLAVWDAELERLQRGQSNTEEERKEVVSQFPVLESCAAHKSRPDNSETNGSSIAILLEHQGASVLLAADAFITDLDESLFGLARARAEDPANPRPLHVDAFKLSHHGSRANLRSHTFRAVQADHYVVSTDGGHDLPNDEALARVVLYGGDEPALWFNYGTERNLRWGDNALQRKYNFEAHFPEKQGEGVTVICRPATADNDGR